LFHHLRVPSALIAYIRSATTITDPSGATTGGASTNQAVFHNAYSQRRPPPGA
jgi:hypothetical protein